MKNNPVCLFMSSEKTKIAEKLSELQAGLACNGIPALARRLGLHPQQLYEIRDGKGGYGERVVEGLVNEGVDLNWFYGDLGTMLREDKAPSVEPVDVSLTGALILLELFAQNPDRQRDFKHGSSDG